MTTDGSLVDSTSSQMSEPKVVFTVIEDIYSSPVVECILNCDPLMIDSDDQVIVQNVVTNEILAAKKLSDCPEGHEFGQRLVRFERKHLRLSPDQIDKDVKLVYIKACGDSNTFRSRAEDEFSSRSLTSTSVLPMSSRVVNGPNGCQIPSDSFDWFGDDLTELILSYLPLEDKIRLECVSKQWQRLIYKSVIHFNDNFLWPKKKFDDKPRLGKDQMKNLLIKCHNLKTIDLRISEISISWLSLLADCPRLKSIELRVAEKVSLEELTDSVKTIGSKVITLYRFGIFSEMSTEILELCPNLKHLHSDQWETIVGNDLVPSLNTLGRVEVSNVEDVNSNDISDFTKLVEKYSNTLKKIYIVLWDDDEEDVGTEAFFNQLFRLKNIERLDFSIHTDLEFELIPKFIALSQSCPKLQSITFRLHDIDLGPSTKPMKGIKRLRLQCDQISDDSFANISDLMPNLRELEMYSNIIYTKEHLFGLSRMKHIERLLVSSWEERGHSTNDLGVNELLDNCPKLRELELDFYSNITSATIDKLKDLSAKRPKEKMRFATMSSEYNSMTVYFGNLSIEFNPFVMRLWIDEDFI